MKINLKPMVEMTDEEKKTLLAFATDFKVACEDISSCEDCPLHTLRDDNNLSDTCTTFISRLFYALDIN